MWCLHVLHEGGVNQGGRKGSGSGGGVGCAGGGRKCGRESGRLGEFAWLLRVCVCERERVCVSE